MFLLNRSKAGLLILIANTMILIWQLTEGSRSLHRNTGNRLRTDGDYGAGSDITNYNDTLQMVSKRVMEYQTKHR